GTTRAFRSTLATADRPFAVPGDQVQLSLDPRCHSASPGFSPPDQTSGAVSDVASIVFRPPGGPRAIVALATDCSPDLNPARARATRGWRAGWGRARSQWRDASRGISPVSRRASKSWRRMDGAISGCDSPTRAFSFRQVQTKSL